MDIKNWHISKQHLHYKLKMGMLCGSFRMDEQSSLRRLGRSSSSLVVSEADAARISGYERLSQSMRFPGDSCNTTKRRGWRSILSFFSYKKKQASTQTAAEPPKKRPATWTPHPHRRWPVQGW